MGLFFKNDPVLSILHERFNANILRVPDSRIAPLGVIEKPLFGTVKFRTTIDQLLTDSASFDLDADDFDIKKIHSISGEKTNNYSAGIALGILSGLLSGKSVQNDKSLIHSTLADVNSFAYSFEHIERVWVDNGLLAKALEKHRLRKNALTNSFFGLSASKLLLIDSVIQSKEFIIYLDEHITDDYQLQLKTLSERIGHGSTNFTIINQDRGAIHFEGEQGIPIAFTCLQLKLDKEGQIIGMPPRSKSGISEVFGVGYEGELEKTMLEPGDDLPFLDVIY